MKTSQYNYYISLGNGRTLVYNGITQRYFAVSEKNSGAIRKIIENPTEENFSLYKTFLRKMISEGFVLNDEVDEYDLVIKKYEKNRVHEQYFLLLFPTYACNLRCWYCTQDHADINMDDDLMEKLKKHIPRYLQKNPEVKKLYISWFGGEPMLGFNRIVELNTFAKEYCEKNNVSFTSGITTNSTLMTREKIERLRGVNVWHYQITIDGDEKSHNKTKQLKSGNAYKTALENIRLIVELIPEAQCILRINYSDRNLNAEKIINGINKEIPSMLRNRITVLPRRIWQVDIADIDESELSKLGSIAKESGFKIGEGGLGMCYVNQKHYTCVMPDGGIIKCDNTSIKDSKGYIDEKGDIVRTDLFEFEKIPPLYEDIICSKCKYFPVCLGPCPSKIDGMIREYGDVRCHFQNADEEMEKYIKELASDV